MKLNIIFAFILCFSSYSAFCEPDAVLPEQALIESGMKAVQENRLQEALADFRQAKKLNSKYAPALVGEAQVLTLQNAWDEALNLLNRAIKLDPEFAIAYHNRGILRYYKKQYLEAHADLRKAVELGESVDREMLFQVWGAAFPEDAVQALSEQISVNPKDGEAYLNRGIAYFYQNNYQRTLNDWKKAKELGTEPDPVMWAELGRALPVSEARHSAE
ncbi:MAG TPA: tetratricopeptide repeat protein [Candidatus Omnitrophota bacterium]|nr:tetratricopeptide repeat protein [Candidatus Omnitrophota bacterium]